MLYIRPPRAVAESMARKRLAEIHLSEKDVDVYGDDG